MHWDLDFPESPFSIFSVPLKEADAKTQAQLSAPMTLDWALLWGYVSLQSCQLLPYDICHVILDNVATNVGCWASKRVIAVLQIDMPQVGALRVTR